MAAEYKKNMFRGVVVGVTRLADNHSFLIPQEGEDDESYNNTEYVQYKEYVDNGGEVLDAVADPIIYAGQDNKEYRVQTVGTTPTELLRIPLTTLTGYTAIVEVIGIDANNGVMKALTFRSVFKRLSGGALAVGNKVDLSNHQDSGAPATTAGVANWVITPSVSGNDALINVAGHTGRTINWFAFVTIRSFRPDGVGV